MSYVTEQTLAAKTHEWQQECALFTYERKLRLDPGRAALLVIDMQRYFAHPSGRAFLPAARAVLPGLSRLIRGFQQAGRPVLWTRHGHSGPDDLGMLGRFWGDYIRRGEQQWQIVEELAPGPDDLVLDKTRYDAFRATKLESLLQARGVAQVVVTGVMTHLCCETTARSAFVRDFEVYFVIDATATSCEEHHRSALRNLANGFAIPLTVAQVEAALRS